MVVSRRAPAGLRADLHSILGIRMEKEMGMYLGVPLTAGVPRLKHFDSLRAKITTKLNGWRGRNLSLAGRICLINHSLLPVLFHFLAHCRVPKGLLTWLNVQLRCFIWNHTLEEKKWHRLGSFHGEIGGTGILDIRAWYEALSRRHAIKVLTEPNLG